jgi:hypothetical protein
MILFFRMNHGYLISRMKIKKYNVGRCSIQYGRKFKKGKYL